MDKEQLKAQPTGKRAERVPVWKKPLLTVTEAAEYTGISAADQIQQRSERMKLWLYKANEIVALRRHGLDEGG